MSRWHGPIRRDELNNRRAQEMAKMLRAAGYEATVIPIAQALAVVDWRDTVTKTTRRIRSEADWTALLQEAAETARSLSK